MKNVVTRTGFVLLSILLGLIGFLFPRGNNYTTAFQWIFYGKSPLPGDPVQVHDPLLEIILAAGAVFCLFIREYDKNRIGIYKWNTGGNSNRRLLL
jgi:hypothetical protein